jgi:hypothetical protein
MNPSIEPKLAFGIVLADHVIVERGSNKHSAIGMFSRFVIAKFPSQVPEFFVLIGVTNIQGAVNQMSVTLRLEDQASGHVVLSVSANIQRAETAPPMDRDEVIELALPFQNLVFPAAGKYQVVVLVDNEAIDQRPLSVISATPSN